MYHKNTPRLRRLNRGGQQSSQIKSKAATERTGPAASAAGPALICRSYIFVPPVGPPAGAALAGGGFADAGFSPCGARSQDTHRTADRLTITTRATTLFTIFCSRTVLPLSYGSPIAGSSRSECDCPRRLSSLSPRPPRPSGRAARRHRRSCRPGCRSAVRFFPDQCAQSSQSSSRWAGSRCQPHSGTVGHRPA